MISKGVIIVLLNRFGVYRDVGKMIADMVFAEDKRLYDEYQLLAEDIDSFLDIHHWNICWFEAENTIGVGIPQRFRLWLDIIDNCNLWLDSPWYCRYIDRYNRAIELLVD